MMYVDPNGHFTISALILIGLGVGATVGAGASIVSQGISNGWENINWWQVGLDGLVGGLGGALLNGDDLGSWQTWASIGVATLVGGIAGLAGGVPVQEMPQN